MRIRHLLIVSSLWVAAVASAHGQQKTADQGVYTAAQAARGNTAFDNYCSACHREPGGTAAVLAGDRFMRLFGDATLDTVFTTIKTTMPRNAPGSLTDANYVDIVAHLLRLNGLADGMNELAVADLRSITIPGTGGSLDQALVQVVGCLSRNGRVWTLTAAGEPSRTREPDAAKDDEAARLDAQAPGTKTFRLQQVYGAPDGWTDQRVAAKGFLSQAGAEARVTVTSLKTLATRCQP